MSVFLNRPQAARLWAGILAHAALATSTPCSRPSLLENPEPGAVELLAATAINCAWGPVEEQRE
ncbi:hypothetical protein M7I_3870 [Glarea lozoyensis 74030]|uniref:Uncharacterized protein n=1 Tax=Glarea lozoyensis (strain ATCC 74030 / MF5533) TaxID=1104152 RepID=H0EMN1_GLAL7|nr:hypothetical protein M7I_3870 [Glarea lozoyensis 74030]